MKKRKKVSVNYSIEEMFVPVRFYDTGIKDQKEAGIGNNNKGKDS